MSGTMRWQGAATASRLSRERDAATEENREIATETGRIENANDRRWLADLKVDEPFLLPSMIKAIELSLAWLEAHPTRALGGPFRARFERFERAVECARSRVAKGLPAYAPADSAEAKERSRRAFAREGLIRARVAEARAKRPDWMRDPSLLPKRPPGKP